MRLTTTRRRAAAAGCATVLAAAMVVTGAGAAAAHSADNSGGTETVEGYAVGSLPSPDGSFGVLLTVFDPADRRAFAGVEIFGEHPRGYYECFEGRPIRADLEGLRDGDAWGRTKLACGGPDFPRGFTAHVTVDVDWDGYGPVARERFIQEGCTVRVATRQADVQGRVTVRIPHLGVKEHIDDGFGDLRRITSVCPGEPG